MVYYYQPEKKVSSIIAYLFIFGLTISLGYFINGQKQIISSQAASQQKITNLLISNKFSTSANISFQTPNKSRVYLKYGTYEPLNKIAFDLLNTEGNNNNKLHYFSLPGLQPNTTYYFSVIIEKNEVKKITNNYFKTAPKIDLNASNPPIFGKILSNNLKPLKDILIKVSFPEINPDFYYSAFSNENGEWIITLPYVYDQNFQNIKPTAQTQVKYQFFSAEAKTSLVYGYYKSSNPLQSIILGQNYNLLENNSEVLGINKQKFQLSAITITNPQEGQILSNFSPVFRGVGFPNTPLNIEILPNNEQGSILTNEYGEWKYMTQSKLFPGKYLFTVYDPQKKGSEKSNLNFIIGKSGESVLGSATDSATITPSSPSPTEIVPTIQPTTFSASATPYPTIMVTQQLTEAPVFTPTPAVKKIVDLGFNNNFFILTASTLSLLGLFLILY